MKQERAVVTFVYNNIGSHTRESLPACDGGGL